MSAPRVACLVGATASGKSALALELAEDLDAEIVSADSRQIYRGMDVGTAKPSAAERARVPHHCLDLVDPTEVFDAARFRIAGSSAIAAIHRRGRRVLVVGGTGLYVRALLYGLCPAPPRVPAIRRALGRLAVAEGAAALHRHLTAIDPTAATRIHPRDTVRAQRALEVAFATGRRLSDWQAAHAFAAASYEALLIGLALPTVALEARITARTEAMVAAGFADEVRALRARVGDEAPAWRTVGYREMLAYVEGRASREQALAATVLATRRFAKRQRTWFRGEPAVLWRHPERDRQRIREEVSGFLAGGAAVAASG